MSSCRSAQEITPLISFADGCTSKNPSKEKTKHRVTKVETSNILKLICLGNKNYRVSSF